MPPCSRLHKLHLRQMMFSIPRPSAKNELFHLCEEIKETGDAPPTLEDVISLILEDVLGESKAVAAGSADVEVAGRRALHTIGKHPVLAKRRRRALRAHHLSHNRFTRPRRLGHHTRHLQATNALGDLMDAISITGGYEGSLLFLRVELDLSKQSILEKDALIEKPLDLLSEVDFLTDLFGGSGSGGIAGSIDADISFSASAHVGVLGKLAQLHFDLSRICCSHSAHTAPLLPCVHDSGLRYHCKRNF